MSAALVVEDDDHEPHAAPPEVLRVGLLGCGRVGAPEVTDVTSCGGSTGEAWKLSRHPE